MFLLHKEQETGTEIKKFLIADSYHYWQKVTFLMDIARLTEYFFSKCRLLFVLRSFFYHFFYSFFTANVFSLVSEIAFYGLYMCVFELSFPFILSFISPQAINPFLLLTRVSVTTRLINFRSRSPVFFLSPPFWRSYSRLLSVNSASGSILYLSCVPGCLFLTADERFLKVSHGLHALHVLPVRQSVRLTMIIIGLIVFRAKWFRHIFYTFILYIDLKKALFEILFVEFFIENYT